MKDRIFTKGQTVCLKIVEGSNEYRRLPKEPNGRPDIVNRLIETNIVSVTNTYITVEYRNLKFEVKNDYREHSNYSANYEIFETVKDAINDDTKEILWRTLRTTLSYTYNKCPYTLEQIEKVLEILNITV